MTTKPIPIAPEAEAALIGALLCHRDAITVVANSLSTGDFHSKKHAAIYGAMLALMRRGEPPDLVTVSAELEKHGWLAKVGGNAALAQMIDAAPVPVHLENYAHIVREKAERRRLIRAAQEIANIAYNGDQSAEDLRAAALDKIVQLGAGSKSTIEGRAATGALFDEISDISRNRYEFPKWGLPSIDSLVKLRPASYTIVGAVRSEGKSALLMRLMITAARSGKNILCASTEMCPEDITRRIVSYLTGIPFTAQCEPLDAASLQRVTDALAEIDEWPGSIAYIDGSISVEKLRLEATARTAMGKLDLLVVDYIQKIAAPGRSGYERVTAASDQCQQIAKDLRVPIVVASQLSRRAVGQTRPTLDTLKESGGLENDADAALLLHRDEEYSMTLYRAVKWYLEKNRNGALGEGALTFDVVRFAFEEM